MATGTQLSPTSSRSAAASTSAAASRSAAATRSSSRASSARPPTSSPRTTCARARGLSRRGARRRRTPDLQVVFASKAFPCTAVLALFAQEGLGCDVASAGELHLALRAGFAPERIVLHGNAKSEAELRMALRHRVGHDRDRQRRRDRAARAADREGELGDRAARPAGADARHPGRARRHAREDLDRPGRLEVRLRDRRGAARRSSACGAVDGLELRGLHAHIGSQLLELEPFRRAAARVARLGEFPVYDLGGGLGVRYTDEQPAPPTIEEYVDGGRRGGASTAGSRRSGC